MIVILPDSHGKILGIRVTGKLTDFRESRFTIDVCL